MENIGVGLWSKTVNVITKFFSHPKTVSQAIIFNSAKNKSINHENKKFSKDFVSNLPVEINYLIANQLDHDSVLELIKVSRLYATTIGSPDYWQQKLQQIGYLQIKNEQSVDCKTLCGRISQLNDLKPEELFEAFRDDISNAELIFRTPKLLNKIINMENRPKLVGFSFFDFDPDSDSSSYTNQKFIQFFHDAILYHYTYRYDLLKTILTFKELYGHYIASGVPYNLFVPFLAGIAIESDVEECKSVILGNRAVVEVIRKFYEQAKQEEGLQDEQLLEEPLYKEVTNYSEPENNRGICVFAN